MSPRPKTAVFAVIIVLLVLSIACSTGFLAGRATTTPGSSSQGSSTVSPGGGTNASGTPVPTSNWQPANRDALFAPFWEAWDLVHQLYVDQPVDDVALMHGAISGMMQALGDKHSSYMSQEQYTQANMPLEQEYEGIGAWVDTTGQYLKIVSPMPNSPAEAAGLKAGDTIIKIDGEDMTGIPGDLVIKKVLGPKGSDVTLTVVREGVADPFDVVVTRAKITIASVEGKMLENGIAYIQILQFAANTRDELRTQLKDLLAQNPKGLIIDLRNNGGGYLDTAVQVTSEFVKEGTVLYEEYGDGTRKNYDVLGDGLGYDIPMVILVNEGTASASEIVSGALQDFGRAALVGVQTYGKGSVQQWIPLANNQGAVRVTVARWLTPKSRQINEVGLTPDYVVELTQDDINAGRDPQLDKAVELLGGAPLPPGPTPTPTTVP